MAANIGITHIISYTVIVQFMGNISGGQRQGFMYVGVRGLVIQASFFSLTSVINPIYHNNTKT